LDRFQAAILEARVQQCHTQVQGEGQVESAHPTRLPNARSVPTADELKAIIPDNFFKQAEQSLVMQDLIDQLAAISAETGRKLLQNDTKKRENKNDDV
jgi:hypothetical protein